MMFLSIGKHTSAITQLCNLLYSDKITILQLYHQIPDTLPDLVPNVRF